PGRMFSDLLSTPWSSWRLFLLQHLDLGGGLEVPLLGGHPNRLALLECVDCTLLAVGPNDLGIGGQGVAVFLAVLVRHRKAGGALGADERPHMGLVGLVGCPAAAAAGSHDDGAFHLPVVPAVVGVGARTLE